MTWLEETTIMNKEQRDKVRYSGNRSPRELCEAQAKTTAKKLIDWLRSDPNYKVMVRLVSGGYRNMSYEADWALLLEELGIEKRKEATK